MPAGNTSTTTPASAQYAQIYTPMPIPGTPAAPKYNGYNTKLFLDTLVLHGRAANITDKDDLIPYIVRYSSDEVRENIQLLEEFDDDIPNKTWDAAVKVLSQLYASRNRPRETTVDELKAFVKQAANKPPFTSKIQIEAYYRDFLKIAAPLKKNKALTTEEHNAYFVDGLPSAMKEGFNNKLTTKNRSRATPPTITQSIEILDKRFDKDSFLYEDWKNVKTLKTVQFDEEGNRVVQEKPRTETKETVIETVQDEIPPAKSSTPPGSIEELTRAMEDMRIHISRLERAAREQPNATPSSTPAPAAQPTEEEPEYCFGCGEDHPDHVRGIRNCSAVKRLLAAGRIRYHPDTGLLVLPDLKRLPYVPRGQPGGLLAYLDQQIPEPPPTARTTNAAPLSVIFEDGHNLDRNNRTTKANPALRDGKDTNVRFNPMKRPDTSKEKGKAPAQKPAPLSTPPTTKNDAQAPGSTSTPQPQRDQPQKNMNIPPPTNPINRQDGWKKSVPSKDVEMKDSTKQGAKDKSPQNTPQYRITSDVQENVDYKKVFDRMMDKEVQVPIRELIGISPALQKIMSESTRPRREYSARQAEYSSAQAAELCAKYDLEAMEQIYLNGSDNDAVEVIYADGTEVDAMPMPSKPFLAMITGAFTVHINDVPFRVMIDTGSELNVCDASIPNRCTLPLDYTGSNWSLRGIHGGPERLGGLCSNVDFKIGSHIFPISMFVSQNEKIGAFDIILGQPFLHWFSSSIDYNRSGEVRLTLRKDGERNKMPTLSIVIVAADDPRNQTEIQTTRPNHSTTIEEVTDSDEEDKEDF
ncbi:hypothetical protein BDZ89DRAFT_965120 [Hymenopellis radicata]|nr:hypothetical protein BDZ89DRAFT_965120 [Hymenopellis radicata]